MKDAEHRVGSFSGPAGGSRKLICQVSLRTVGQFASDSVYSPAPSGGITCEGGKAVNCFLKVDIIFCFVVVNVTAQTFAVSYKLAFICLS